ncbi:hypothetical protein [Streptomyces antimycoticus]|uniref:hypothetical protein n=1 Tax=Streptomyces antimycoticus TaxID=68175 RepID=UPI0038686200|nr:hypothetical protein OG751_41230 [Streptomyces antimycoticus]
MRSLPHASRTARQRPRPRLPHGLLSAVAAACAIVTAAGCAAQSGVRDDGAVPSLSAPASAVPLWPHYTPSAASSPRQKPDFDRYLPVSRLRLPSGGLTAVSAQALLLNDPNVPALVQKEISVCPGSGDCPLRSAVHRDLTGDGKDEQVVAVDLPRLDRTLLQVYTASGRTVRPVLIYWGPPGLTGETFGRDLLISATGEDGRVTTRFRWNGRVMAAVTPENGAGARATEPGADPEAVPEPLEAVPEPLPDGAVTAAPGPRTEKRATR